MATAKNGKIQTWFLGILGTLVAAGVVALVSMGSTQAAHTEAIDSIKQDDRDVRDEIRSLRQEMLDRFNRVEDKLDKALHQK